MKICNKCKQEKPLDSFFKDKNNKTDGHYSICKECKTKSSMAWREVNREDYNANQRRHHKKHALRNRLYRYKLTPEQYQHMLHAQNGRCKICGELPKGKRPLVVDHNHASSEVRGLLCYGCNRAIAILDKPELLQKAKEYLKKDIDR